MHAYCIFFIVFPFLILLSKPVPSTGSGDSLQDLEDLHASAQRQLALSRAQLGPLQGAEAVVESWVPGKDLDLPMKMEETWGFHYQIWGYEHEFVDK
jgi:hypothetical protein